MSKGDAKQKKRNFQLPTRNPQASLVVVVGRGGGGGVCVVVGYVCGCWSRVWPWLLVRSVCVSCTCGDFVSLRIAPVIKWCGNGCSVCSLYMLEINCIPEFVCLLWSVYMSICCHVKLGVMDGGELVLT
jgi:hypothetical protein